MIDPPGSVAAIRAQLAEALHDRYLVTEEIARGGMATVYRARDLERQEPVAIKVMRPRVASLLGTERFMREINVAASMAHPLIVPLRDWGRVGELLYYVMPWIAGGSLYIRLQREKRLPLDDALRIVHDVAEALGYAHERRVLHRDVKPENILLDGSRALVADFGLARAVGATEYQRLTETGVIVGTVYYMSPEQLREDPDLDARADIYSLGCILYEMLTGGPPYTGATLTDLTLRILRAPVPSLRVLLPEAPDAVEQVITRALAKAPADRFATMREFAVALPQRPT